MKRRNPLVVRVSHLLQGPDDRAEVHRSAELPDLRVTGSSVPAGAEVDVDLVLERVESAIEARGTVRAPWTGECTRCLRPVTGELEAGVREIFERNSVEGETYPLHDGEIDLEPLVREAVLLELPQVPLCREDCLGLCLTCGADRNEGDCGHVPRPQDPRWAALDELRTDD